MKTYLKTGFSLEIKKEIENEIANIFASFFVRKIRRRSASNIWSLSTVLLSDTKGDYTQNSSCRSPFLGMVIKTFLKAIFAQ